MNHAFVRPNSSFPQQLQPGDHVRVWRGFYWHHAVYIGNGRFIEFGSSLLGGVVARVSWADFARGAVVDRVRHTDALPPSEVAARAQSQLGRSGFSLLGANCEHFATWCATGRWESTQVRVAWACVACAAVVWLGTNSPRQLRSTLPRY